MKIRNQFLLFFISFILIITTVIGALSLIFIKYEIDLFANSPNISFAAIMAEKMFMKSLIGFISLTLLVIVVSLFVGLFIVDKLSKSLLSTIQRITGLAESRVKIKKRTSEDQILKEYISVLIEDQKKLAEYDKINSWKEGARLLIHEITNPLTPLKLSVQSLSYSDVSGIEDEVSAALTSIGDIESILKNFRNLVNIDYQPIYRFNFIDFLNKLKIQFRKIYPDIEYKESYLSSDCNIMSEENLLKMIIVNLIKNGIEANPKGFQLNIDEYENKMFLSFITKNRKLSNPENCFKFGYSEKGRNRGYGLYLCRKIADYLNIEISAENIGTNVLFKLKIVKGD